MCVFYKNKINSVELYIFRQKHLVFLYRYLCICLNELYIKGEVGLFSTCKVPRKQKQTKYCKRTLVKMSTINFFNIFSIITQSSYLNFYLYFQRKLWHFNLNTWTWYSTCKQLRSNKNRTCLPIPYDNLKINWYINNYKIRSNFF